MSASAWEGSSRKYAGPLSDFDFGVLFRATLSPAERFRRRLSLIAELIGELHAQHLDVVVLNKAPPAIRFKIIEHGQIIGCLPEKHCYTFTDEITAAVRVSLLEEHLPWEERDGAYEPIERPHLLGGDLPKRAGRAALSIRELFHCSSLSFIPLRETISEGYSDIILNFLRQDDARIAL